MLSCLDLILLSAAAQCVCKASTGNSPRRTAHLEVLVSKSDADIAPGAFVLDEELIVVDHLALGHRVVALDAANVVAVRARPGVLDHKLAAVHLEGAAYQPAILGCSGAVSLKLGQDGQVQAGRIAVGLQRK